MTTRLPPIGVSVSVFCQRFEQRERSRFTRAADGRWVYTDGVEA
ncbi:hypothetical protein [Leucobacter sp. wl10]|nr:hypothetical protein [Leucobacter sp. wl10]